MTRELNRNNKRYIPLGDFVKANPVCGCFQTLNRKIVNGTRGRDGRILRLPALRVNSTWFVSLEDVLQFAEHVAVDKVGAVLGQAIDAPLDGDLRAVERRLAAAGL